MQCSWEAESWWKYKAQCSEQTCLRCLMVLWHLSSDSHISDSHGQFCFKPSVGDDFACSNVRVGGNLCCHLAFTSTVSALHNIVINMACMSDQNMLPGLGRHIFHLSPGLSSAQLPTNSIIGCCRRQPPGRSPHAERALQLVGKFLVWKLFSFLFSQFCSDFANSKHWS